MPDPLGQDKRIAQLNTPLGKDKLTLVSFTCSEGVSEKFQITIEAASDEKGLNFDSTLALARHTPIPVIASGGLASMQDVHRLASPECTILEGAITGRALYDGRIDAQDALRVIKTTEAA